MIDLTWGQLLAAMSLLVLPLAINYKFSLGLTRTTLISIVRMSVQLILVGFYLSYVLALNSALLNILWLGVMLLVASSSIISHAKLPQQKMFLPVLSGLLLGLVPLLAILLILLLKPIPLYNAQYLIPLAGMLLGNSLSGNIVCLQRFFDAFNNNFEQYEAALALGATPYQATLPFMQQALRQAQAPILASMAVSGIVTLPGMMTGQILGGVDPLTAIKYQLLILGAIFVMLTISITVTLLISQKVGFNNSGLLLIKSTDSGLIK